MRPWHDGGHQIRGGRHDGGVRSEEGGLGCWLVGVTGSTTARTTACRWHEIADEEAGWRWEAM
jgi:hypothetical protein